MIATRLFNKLDFSSSQLGWNVGMKRFKISKDSFQPKKPRTDTQIENATSDFSIIWLQYTKSFSFILFDPHFELLISGVSSETYQTIP